jgi:hypothetical protein
VGRHGFAVSVKSRDKVIVDDAWPILRRAFAADNPELLELAGKLARAEHKDGMEPSGWRVAKVASVE